MGLKQKLKNSPTVYSLLMKILNSVNYFTIRFRVQYPKYKVTETWKRRIALVRESADNSKLTLVSNAGTIYHDHQIMHNGLKIKLGSYYDYGNTILLEKNKGVHEPQEEYVFQEILKEIPDGGSMMELGSYWAFYSMWFASQIKNAKCYMIEPDPHKMNFGKLNFKLNNLRGTFDLGFLDGHTDLIRNIPIYSVDHLMTKYNIDFLNILHSDIQGYEFKMLEGAKESIAKNKIGYVFISTHSNELHYQCRDFLIANNFYILCSADLNETYSWDGLLVARSKHYAGPTSVEVSKRRN